MPGPEQKRREKIKAGIFVVLMIILLIFSMLWLKYFSVRPIMTIIAMFENPGPISKGVQAYYKGMIIGRVSNLAFNEDFSKTLVYVDIHEKKLKIPDNSLAEVKVEGITGQKYIDIVPPLRASDVPLMDKDIIYGKSLFGLSDLEYYLQEQVRSGRLERIMGNIERTFDNTDSITRNIKGVTNEFHDERVNIKQIIQNGSSLIKNLDQAAKTINDFSAGINSVEGNQSVLGDLKTSAENINNAAVIVNSLAEKLEDEQFFEETSLLLKKASYSSSEINKILSDLKKSGVGGCEIGALVKNTDNTVCKANCISNKFSELLSKRFLLLRLMFGRPGADFSRCNTTVQP